MLFDTHSHLDDEAFDEDRDELIWRIHNEHNVDLIMVVGADMDSSRRAIELSEKYDFIYAAVGVHPHDAEGMSEKDIDELKYMSKHEKVKAIGEIGLDYYYDNSPRDLQKFWFARQMQLAREVSLPVIIHDRDAHADCMQILKDERVDITGGVFHCFSGSAQMAREAIKLGMHISFAGPITFKNAVKTVEAASEVPIEKMFIETDCPYLAPVPHRGERNHSGNVSYVAQRIAKIKQMPYEQVAAITRQNAIDFFKIEI